MKIRLAFYIALLCIVIAGFIHYMNPPWLYPRWSPFYCSRFSGSHSAAWGGQEECEKVGCKIVKTGTFDIPGTFDASGYIFKCVKK